MTAQAGWYPDPSGNTSKLRYWDGTQWTDQYTDSPDAASNTNYTVTINTVNINETYPRDDTQRTLLLVAFVFSLISTLISAFIIIPLAWMIPMTVVSWGIYKGTRPNTIAFGVCSLIFVSLIAGILLLCARKDPR